MRRRIPEGPSALLLILLAGVGAGLAGPAPAAEPRPTPPVEIREWAVPWEGTRPRDPFAVSGETVWFVGQVGHYLARLEVPGDDFDKVDLPDRPGPHNLVVDEDGVVWYAGNLNGTIGRYDPDAGGAGSGEEGEGLAAASTIERIPMPDAAARDPHTLVLAPGGALWFTVQGGNFVGRMDRTSREVELVRVPTPNARPYGIVASPDGGAWVALFGTHALARVEADPEAGKLALSTHPLPRSAARPRRLGLTSDGRVWYVDYAGGRLGAYDPAADAFREWRLPSGEDARPYAMAVDDRDRIWLVETGPQPNRLVGFDPQGGKDGAGRFLGAADIPSGGGTVRHMHFHEPSRTLWFGTDANTIGRATLLPSGADGTAGP